MLIVAPSGSTNSDERFDTPALDTAHSIVTGSVAYAASPFVSLSNLIQYDNRSRNLGWQSRVRWTVQPGDDLFFVFNQGWIREETDAGTLRFSAQDRKISAKIQYAFRF